MTYVRPHPWDAFPEPVFTAAAVDDKTGIPKALADAEERALGAYDAAEQAEDDAGFARRQAEDALNELGKIRKELGLPPRKDS